MTTFFVGVILPVLNVADALSKLFQNSGINSLKYMLMFFKAAAGKSLDVFLSFCIYDSVDLINRVIYIYIPDSNSE